MMGKPIVVHPGQVVLMDKPTVGHQVHKLMVVDQIEEML
jgi:hypothetical protein